MLLAIGLAGAFRARAWAAPDPREVEAREDFAVGRYQLAAEIFARLYAETLHPVYLRNIGRCYQNLGEPDRAIASFRDYLHKAKSVSADERAEVEGYISEMQDLKRQREGGAAKPAPASAPTAAGPVTPLAPPPVAKAPATRIDLVAKSPPPVAEATPIYGRWWFWAIVAGVAGVGVGVAAAAGAFTHAKDAGCMPPFMCGN